jgi:RHS repeat-associated protein
MDGTGTSLDKVFFYDERGRIIQVQNQNHMGGSDVVTKEYDFSGKVLNMIRKHTTSSTSDLYIFSHFDYDHAGRLLNTKFGVGNNLAIAQIDAVTLSALEYDELGKLIEKKLHSTDDVSFLQNINFSYSIEGWLKEINDVDDMSASSTTQLSNVKIDWYDPHNNGNRYYYGETHLQPNQDGAIEMIYDGTIRTYCGWRKVNGSGSSPYMNLVKHNNGSWYVWNSSFQTKMTKPANFVNVGDKIRLERVGNEFHVYVNDNLEHTIVENGSAAEELIPVGIRTGSGGPVSIYTLDPKFYRYLPVEAADLFAMKLDYTTDNTQAAAIAQYNGNISQTTWKVLGNANKSIYGFQYDDLSRLTQAKYVEMTSSGSYTNIDNYTVSGITYDLNGNIQTLNRHGWDGTGYSQIDQMYYGYQNNSNTLQVITDYANSNKGFIEKSTGSGDYTYDLNGNMTKDLNKNISNITYNHLNLPTVVTFTTGETITWIYNASGKKLTKIANDGSGNILEKNYVGGIEYVKTGTTHDLEAIYHSEGRIVPTTTGYQYEYSIKDYLGNTRVSFADLNKDGEITTDEILQSNHYYPFGMVQEGNQVAQQGAVNPRQYNGKELNSDFGLNWSHYGSRFYDASMARWSAIDPQASRYAHRTPYSYVGNMPTIAIDPNGEEIYIVIGNRSIALDELLNNIEHAGLVAQNSDLLNAITLLFDTDDGIKLITEFSGDTGTDIYIKVGILGPGSSVLDVDSKGAPAAATAPYRKGSNRLNLDHSDPGNRDFINVMNGTQIHDVENDNYAIVVNQGYLKKNPPFGLKITVYDHAETIYHEIYSHVKNAGKNGHAIYGVKGHSNWGIVSNQEKYKKALVPNTSYQKPVKRIVRQLKGIRDRKKTKSNRLDNGIIDQQQNDLDFQDWQFYMQELYDELEMQRREDLERLRRKLCETGRCA